MAARIFREIKSLIAGHRVVTGSFRPAGSGTPTNVTGRGFTVVRTSEGLNTVTFQDKYASLESLEVSLRVADATATFVQGGDYSAANKTLQIRTLQAGAGTARGKTIQLPFLGSILPTRTKTVELATAGALLLGSTPPTVNATAGGLAFDADAETAYLAFRVPEDWDRASDMTLRLIWHNEAGTAIAQNETVIWETDYRCVASGGAVDGGNVVALDTTYTEAGNPGTDKEEHRTDITLDYDHADQPLAAGDTVYVTISRDMTTDTYAADAVLTRVELAYSKPLALLEAIEGNGDGPYLARVNGSTDPALRIVWPAGDVTPVQLPPVMWPTDMDEGANAIVTLRAASSSTNDTPVIAVGAYESVGDSNFGGNTAALSDTVGEKTVTLAHANIAGHPSMLNLVLTPGTHNTDAVHLYVAALEYTSTESPDAFALADLPADADSVISFCAHFRNSSVNT